jgi:SAM-dependent methyltransferase
MQELVRYARRRGFQEALNSCLPPFLQENAASSGRADARFFLPLGPDTMVLDIGCMWGALSVAIAPHCGAVIGIDQTLETLQLAQLRASEEGLSNVSFMCCDALSIPLKHESFDVVLMNGVLEWLGLDGNYVVDEQWGKRAPIHPAAANGSYGPRHMQLAGLCEAFRLLKPGGTLFVAIENRVGIGYFLGQPDDHNGLRFTTLLPRRLADLYSKRALGQPYRTYTYTDRGLQRLLANGGFAEISLLTALPNYRNPLTIAPVDRRVLDFCLINHLLKGARWRGRLLYPFLCLTGLAAKTTPDFLVIGRKTPTVPPQGKTLRDLVWDRWAELFPEHQRPTQPNQVALVKFRSRMEAGASVSFLVFASPRARLPFGYLKLHRDEQGRTAIEREAGLYERIYRRCSSARRALARPFFAGDLDGSVVISREALAAHNVDLDVFRRLETRGSPFLERRIRDLKDALLSRYGGIPNHTLSFTEYADRAISWLSRFADETEGPSISPEAFWVRFVASRLSAETCRELALDASTLNAFRDRWFRLAGEVQLCTGPVHGDFDATNVLVMGDDVAVVDWEHGLEESFPPFDALNFLAQSALDHRATNDQCSVLSLFTPRANDSMSRITQQQLARYAAARNLTPEFMRACAPLLVLDLFYRDYSFPRFPLRSSELFVSLIELVLNSA